MADKEERIYISKHGEDNPCDTCEDTSGEECDSCMENYEWNASITRNEAICKIARAICRAGGNECIGDCESCDLWEVGPEKDYAEAALNALLSSGD